MSDELNIRSPEWWARDDARFNARLDAYDGVPMTEAVRGELINGLWEELAFLRLVARTLALERRPGRPKNGEPKEPKPRLGVRRELTVTPNPELNQVEVLGKPLSADEARELGTRILQVVSDLEGDAEH
jgi:hypothetical protein